MPTEHSPSARSTVYQSEQARMLQTKPKGVVLSIRCMSEADARKWVGECNRLGADQEVTEHFAEQVRQLK